MGKKANSNIAYLYSNEPLDLSTLFKAASKISNFLCKENLGTSCIKKFSRGLRSIIGWYENPFSKSKSTYFSDYSFLQYYSKHFKIFLLKVLRSCIASG